MGLVGSGSNPLFSSHIANSNNPHATTPEKIGAAPGMNYIINGGFEVNQRGFSSVNTNLAYLVDRWFHYYSGSSMVSSQQPFTVGQSDVPGNPKNYSRVVVTSSSGAGNLAIIQHNIESVLTLAGETAVLSFYAKADAAKPIAVSFNQIFGSGGSNAVIGIGVTKLTLSTGWTKYSIPITYPSIAGKTIVTGDYLSFSIWFDAGSNYNSQTDTLGQQSGTFEFAQMKLEAGSVATPFYSNFADELRRCQRYYQKSYNYEVAPGTSGSVYGLCNFVAPAASPSNIIGIVPLSQMRDNPTVTIYALTGESGRITNWVDGTLPTQTVSAVFCSKNLIRQITMNTTLTSGNYYTFHYTASAEL